MRRTAAVVAGVLVSGAALAGWSGPIESTMWKLESKPGFERWLEIHGLASAQQTGIYHVQVLERRAGSPAWQHTSLANHLALTEGALRASITAPSKAKSVYPESFNAAFNQWDARQKSGEEALCKTSVAECL